MAGLQLLSDPIKEALTKPTYLVHICSYSCSMLTWPQSSESSLFSFHVMNQEHLPPALLTTVVENAEISATATTARGRTGQICKRMPLNAGFRLSMHLLDHIQQQYDRVPVDLHFISCSMES